MWPEIILTNNKQRKEFLEDYTNEEIGWEKVSWDEKFRFFYYQAMFSDGSRIMVLESRDGVGVPIKTLVKKGQKYFPNRSTQTEMIEHLKIVANK